MTANKLTPEEVQYVLSFYHWCPIRDGRLILKQVQHMQVNDLYMLCYWVDSEPFRRHKFNEWKIEYGYNVIGIRAGLHAFHVDLETCCVHVYTDGRVTTTSNNGNALQYYRKHHYAFPLFLEKGHWSNGKTPLQLGIAIPDDKPLQSALLECFDNDKEKVNLYLHEQQLLGTDYTDLDILNKEIANAKGKLIIFQ